MKYHISTFGCQMNEADSQRLASELEKLGLRAAPTREEADVLVLNTCVVRQSAEDKAFSYIQTLKPIKQRNPGAVIGVMGCLVGVRGNSPLQKAFPYVDVFMPPSETGPLLDFLRDKGLFAELRAEEVALLLGAGPLFHELVGAVEFALSAGHIGGDGFVLRLLRGD